MKVAILISDIHAGGAEYTARRWAKGLVARGHEVIFYVFKPEISDREVDLSGCRVEQLVTSRSLLRHALLPIRLAQAVRRDRVDVVLTMNYYASVVALATRGTRGFQSAVVVSERNVLSLVHSERGLRQRALRWLAQRLYRGADGVVAISHPVAGDLIGACGIDPDRLSVVPNPVLDVPEADRATVAPRALKVAFVGRIEPQKRPILFVEVLAELASRGFEVGGHVIGTGQLSEEMADAARRAGVELDFVGWREPWTDGLSGVDCLLLPSAYEGFGNVLVEAAAAGIPSVAVGDALGVADAIVPGVTGEIAWSSDPGDLADSVVLAATLSPLGAGAEGWFRRFSLGTSTALLEKALSRAVA